MATVGAFAIGAGTFADVDDPVRILVIAIGVVVLLLGCWLLSLARRPHPHIRRHSVVQLSISEIEPRARAGEPFMLPLGKSEVEVHVRPESVTTDDCEVIIGRKGEEPRRRPLEDVVTFAGKVVDEKESEVRLTITDQWLSGYVLRESEWWFVEPLRKFRLDAGFDDYIAYRTRDLRFKLEFGEDYKPRKVEGGGGGTEPPHRVNPTIPIAMVHDEHYNWQAGGRPYDYQRALINEINGLYQRQLDCRFEIRVFIWTHQWLTSRNAERMLDQVEDAVRTLWSDLGPVANRRATNTEVAHATTGKNLEGTTLGIAWQPGVYSLSQQALVWVGGGGGFGGPPNLAFQNMMVAAHELGHNFDGAHSEADEWCVSHFIWCWDYVRTLMWPTIYDDSVPRFSDGSRRGSNNNVQRVSTNMTSGRNRDF